MDAKRRQEAVLCGDILRACTTTNFVYQGNAIFGANAPTRTIVVYGADKQKWPKVCPAHGNKAPCPTIEGQTALTNVNMGGATGGGG